MFRVNKVSFSGIRQLNENEYQGEEEKKHSKWRKACMVLAMGMYTHFQTKFRYFEILRIFDTIEGYFSGFVGVVLKFFVWNIPFKYNKKNYKFFRYKKYLVVNN